VGKVLVLAGTGEGREIANRLVDTGMEVVVSTLTGYGSTLLPKNCVRLTGPLEPDSLTDILSHGVTAVVDATHPYAFRITSLTQEATARLGIPYFRYSRPRTELPSDNMIFYETDLEGCCRRAFTLGRVVFSTLGVKSLPVLVQEARQASGRVIARILPDQGSLAICLNLGLKPSEIIAMEGPFSQTLNRELLLHFQCDCLITKDSGHRGGTLTKIQAARELGLPVVVYWREPETGPSVYSDINALLEAIMERTRRKNR